MSETNVERYEVEEDSTDTHDPDLILVETEVDDTQSELIKFALLAVVLLGTALVIGLLRPYIFNRIIPAVLGEGQPAATIINTETEAETLKPEADEAESSEATEAEESNESEAEAVEEEGAAASEEPVNPEDFPTAVPPAQTHTVQPGETLTAIAQQYGITVQALVEANQITNPDRVTAGTVLVIPDGQ